VTVRRQQTLPIARPTLERRFGLFSEAVLFETDDPALMAAAEASFGRFPVPDAGEPIRLRVVVDREPRSDRAGIVHRAGGRHYLVTPPGSAAVVDLVGGTATSFVEPGALADQAQLRYTYIEGPALAMITTLRGYFVVHASGVARNGIGVALHGAEGAGKTTLAVACARRGLDVFAEDGVFVHAGPDGLEFWGLPWVQRLVPDAREFFPELRGIEPKQQPSTELKVEVELDRHYPGRAVARVRPAAVVVLERRSGGSSSVERLDGPAAAGMVEVQWPWEPEWSERHEHAVRLLAELPVYRLAVNGTPDDAVGAISALLDELALAHEL
jgi:hypothetical protein